MLYDIIEAQWNCSSLMCNIQLSFFFHYPIFCNWNSSFSYFGHSGDTDSVVPVTATRYSIDALKLPTIINWYPWYDNGKVGTYNWSTEINYHSIIVCLNLSLNWFKRKFESIHLSWIGSNVRLRILNWKPNMHLLIW